MADIKIDFTHNGIQCLLLCDEKYKNRVPSIFDIPSGVRVAQGKDKESGKPMIYIHSKDMEKLFPFEVQN